MFDKLYVLAKGGVCVYTGPPKQLELHLNHCQIQCTEFQFPIEVMLKIATKGSNDKQVMKLSKKSLEDNMQLLSSHKCKTETKLYPNGIPFHSKSFNLLDTWYLFLRTLTYTYVSHWKTLFISFLFYIFCPLLIAKTVNPNIGRPDGCFEYSFRTNKSCLNQWEDDSLLDQNLKFQAFTSVLVMFIQICTTTLTFTSDVKIFMNEHQNSEYSNLIQILFKFYSINSIIHSLVLNKFSLIEFFVLLLNHIFINYIIIYRFFWVLFNKFFSNHLINNFQQNLAKIEKWFVIWGQIWFAFSFCFYFNSN